MNDNEQNHSHQLYEQHLNALTLQGKSSEKTIEMYARSLRKLVTKFDIPPDRITTEGCNSRSDQNCLNCTTFLGGSIGLYFIH